jgi:hypothetical protein
MSLIYWLKRECLGVVHVALPLIEITNFVLNPVTLWIVKDIKG